MKPFFSTSLLALIGATRISAASLAAEPYLPTDSERARWTMSDMRSLATAIEAYAVDHHKAYPLAATFEALVPLVQPSYMKKAPTADAWGHAYAYAPASDGQSYRLVSAGSDGMTDPSSWGAAGPLSNFDDDAVLQSGSITRPWPFR